MNPVIVTTAVVVLGAIAAALGYIFSEEPNVNRPHGYDNSYNGNNDNFRNGMNGPRSGSRNDNRNRKRSKVTIKNSVCAICLETVCGAIEILSCEHGLHEKCFEKLKASSCERKPKCPFCRTAIE